jgi:hypothetical protein
MQPILQEGHRVCDFSRPDADRDKLQQAIATSEELQRTAAPMPPKPAGK